MFQAPFIPPSSNLSGSIAIDRSRRIVFISNKEGPRNLFWQLADGSGGLERLTTSEFVQIPGSWSPDGQLLAFSEINGATGLDIWVLRLGEASATSGQVRKAQPFLQTKF